MTKIYKALTRMGDTVVVVGTAVLATVVLVATMVFDVMRFIGGRRER